MGLCGREQVDHCLLPPDTGNFGGFDKAWNAALPQRSTILVADPRLVFTEHPLHEEPHRVTTTREGQDWQYSPFFCLAYTGPKFDYQHMSVS